MAWRPIVHIEDIARTTLALLEAPADAVRGEAFNVGTDAQNYRIRELAEIVRRRSGCEIEIAGGATNDPRSYRVDFSKLAGAFPALRLEWTADTGARQLLAAYAEHGLTTELFEGHRFIRLNQLRRLLDDGRLDGTLRWADSGDRAA
jgi:nucleoside-diphosphate-sugar epimerase